MIILGIDPGQSGGVAWLDTESPIAGCCPMPETEADLVDHIEGLMQQLAVPYVAPATNLRMTAFVESVHSMPKQGVASSFKFGVNYGMIRGVLAALGIRREFVSPQKWQKAMGCMTRGDKNVSKRRAQELFPQLKVTHAVADALLIAEFGRIASLQGAAATP